jgi:tetratricopeptide (TPR) repeat protein
MSPNSINGKRDSKNAFRFCLNRNQVIYLIAGAIVTASTCTLALADKAPPNWDKLLEKGYAQLAMGNSKEAAEIFSSKLQKYPNSGPCHLAYGKALKRLGKLSDAKGEFRAATGCDGNLADAFYELGVLQESDKEYQDAAASFDKYLQLKPDAAQRQNIPDRIQFCRSHS